MQTHLHTYRLHPAIRSSIHGPVVGAVPVHLQQSDIDGACGPHCAFMALLVFGEIERHDLRLLPTSRRKRQKALWHTAERHYFRGIHAKHLRKAFTPYKAIRVSVEDEDGLKHALQALAQEGLAIVNIANPELNHWVLAVGAGGMEEAGRFKPLWLLVLDPGHGAVPLTAWNALLSTRRSRSQRHAYDTPDGRDHVAIKTVLAVRRIDHA